MIKVNSKTNLKPKPCKCGSTDLTIQRYYQKFFEVICNKCHLEIVGDGKRGAVEIWNNDGRIK